MMIKRLIVRLECGTPIFVDIMENDGIMNLATGTWEDIKRNDKKNK